MKPFTERNPLVLGAIGLLLTAVIVVGPALTASQFPDSHLYSTTRCRP